MINDFKQNLNDTQQKIIEASMDEFLEMGFNGARMQSIADKAGINKALLHYYYRNKETLFKEVFAGLMKNIFYRLSQTVIEEMNWDEKMRKIVKHHMLFLMQNSKLPLFLLNEINRNPELVEEVISEIKLSETWEQVYKVLQNAQKEGALVKIDPTHIIITIMSMIIFPFAAHNVITKFLRLSDSEYKKFLIERIEIVPDLLIQTLVLK
jgi:TetR/AcrR family transcriptional regulator